MFIRAAGTFSACVLLSVGIRANAQGISATNAKTSVSFGRVPLYFEENRGQTDARTKYIARGGSQVAFVTQDGLVLPLNGEAITMRVVNAKPNARMAPEGEIEGVSNYYLGKRAFSGLRHYSGVRVNQIRPGIDILYHGNQQSLEYDFVLHPEQIQRRCGCVLKAARSRESPRTAIWFLKAARAS